MDTNFLRLLEILKVLQAQSALSTTEIQQRLANRGLSASPRTIQRDLESMVTAIGLECDTRCKPYTWRYAKNRPRFSVPGMELPEALSFRLLEDYLAVLMPASVSHHLKPYFDEARTKLGQHFETAPLRRWPMKVRVIAPNQPLIAPTVKRAVHEAVSEALLAEKQLEISYRAVGSESAKSHRIHPLGLVLEGNVPYLVARFYEYDEPRTLALHRIDRAAAQPDAAVAPDGFTLDKYIANGGFGCGGEDMIALDATWRNLSGDHLLQAKLAADQVAETLGKGEVRIRATVLHTERLVWWLLSFGSNVVVHGPASLREEVLEAHVDAVNRYRTRVSKRQNKS